MNWLNDIGVYEEGEETKDIKNEDVIKIDITANGTETYQDTSKRWM